MEGSVETKSQTQQRRNEQWRRRTSHQRLEANPITSKPPATKASKVRRRLVNRKSHEAWECVSTLVADFCLLVVQIPRRQPSKHPSTASSIVRAPAHDCPRSRPGNFRLGACSLRPKDQAASHYCPAGSQSSRSARQQLPESQVGADSAHHNASTAAPFQFRQPESGRHSRTLHVHACSQRQRWQRQWRIWLLQ